MHRHSYQGRKLSRDAGPRKALIRGQVTSLVLYEKIETTEAKAKEVAPYFERLVTKGKRKDLGGLRSLRSFLLTENAVQKMVQELVPAFADRQGGYTRIIKTGNRRGDNAPMAMVSLVLPERVKKSTKEDAGAASQDTASKAPESQTAAAKKPKPAPKSAKAKEASSA